MGKGSFLNQKLGKRVSRKFQLLKSHLASQRLRQRPAPLDVRKKGVSREEKPS
jgi:hypothetical protein